MKLVSKILALKIAAAAFLLPALSASGQTLNLTVPNGDFSNPLNYGTVSSLVSYNNSAMGTGPWRSSGSGVLGLLPPSTRITSAGQNAEIYGIGLNLLGVVQTSAQIFQADTGHDFFRNHNYTLTAQVDLGQVLGANVLNDPGFGIGLLSNGNLVASTTAAGASQTLSLLSGTTYQLTLNYAVPAGAPSSINGSNIGVSLFQQPGGVLGAGLTSVRFDNITLTATVVPEPSSLIFVSLGSVLLLRRQRRKPVKG